MAFDTHGDVAALDHVTSYRLAAVSDGWKQEPTYPGHESIEQAASLERDGWKMHVICRPTELNRRHQTIRCSASIHIWGPDGLAVNVPLSYDWAELQDGLRACTVCKAVDVDTHRVGFAGRVCASCLPEQRRRIETPGWSN